MINEIVSTTCSGTPFFSRVDDFMHNLLMVNPRRDYTRYISKCQAPKYIQDPFWGGAAAVTAKYLQENKKSVKLIYEAMADGIRFMRQDLNAAKAFLPKYTPMEPEVAAKSGTYKWVLLDESTPTTGVQELADLMTAEGVLRNKVDAQAMLVKASDLN
jgi:NitT/TauT family transport system substrate-binding protein